MSNEYNEQAAVEDAIPEISRPTTEWVWRAISRRTAEWIGNAASVAGGYVAVSDAAPRLILMTRKEQQQLRDYRDHGSMSVDEYYKIMECYHELSLDKYSGIAVAGPEDYKDVRYVMRVPATLGLASEGISLPGPLVGVLMPLLRDAGYDVSL